MNESSAFWIAVGSIIVAVCTIVGFQVGIIIFW